MPRPRTPTEYLEGPLVIVATRVRKLRLGLALSYDEAADLVTRAVHELYPTSAYTYDPTRLKEIEGAARGARYAARDVPQWELHAIAKAFGALPVDLIGAEDIAGPISYDPLSDPERASHFLRLIRHAGETASELLGWAEFLPCSLETKEFMHSHHKALFGRLPSPTQSEQQQLVDTYDDIGNARRKQTFGGGRRWVFKHIMFDTDILRIARGDDEYGSIPGPLRKSCLQHLAALIEDRAANVQLTVVPETPALREECRDFDSRVVLGTEFAFWREHTTGTMHWTEVSARVDRVRRSLMRLVDCASHKEPASTVKYLTEIAQQIPHA